MKDNKSIPQFEMITDGHLAFARYRLVENIIYINHVEAAIELRGTGAAGRLMKEICDYCAQHKLKIIPICSYAVVWLKKHKEYADLLA